MNRRARLVVAALSILSVGGNAIASEDECPKLSQLLAQKKQLGMQAFILTASKNDAGEEQYLNLDVDGDDVSDEVKGGCPGSSQVSDVCTLSISLSTGKKQLFSFEAGERFYLFRFMSKVYALATSSSEKARSTRIMRLDRSGIATICERQ